MCNEWDPTATGGTTDERLQTFSAVRVLGSQGEARGWVAEARSRLAVVERGHPRSVLFQCPCGCGDVVVINVDRAAGPAWRLRLSDGSLSLMPSVWRTTGCKSHFILWKNQVWWCRFRGEDEEEEPDWPEEMDLELRAEWSRIRAERRRHLR